MNNTKKFEDFLDKMQGLLDNAKKQGHIIVRVEDLESTFPELKESEDELEWLTNFIEEETYYQTMDIRDDEDRIRLKNLKRSLAWLRKQGEKPEDEAHLNKDEEKPNGGIVLEDFNEGDGFYKINLAYLSKEQVEEIESLVTKWNKKVTDETIKNCIGVCLTDVSEQRFIDYNTSLKDCLAWLEKQGEQEEPQVYETEDDKIITYSENKGYKVIEPKFHEGDWVVCEVTGSVYQIKNCIENLSNHKYGYDLTNGGYIGSDEVNNYHLWTIADAKDGDVLTTSSGAFIYNGNNGGGSCPGCYCGINTLGNFKIGTEHHWTVKKVYPATKDECGFLFQKMKDSGYEWDSEKKEVRKIEQKPKWSEDDEGMLTRCIGAIHIAGNQVCNYYTAKDKEQMKNWLQSLKQRMEDEK